MMSGSQLTRNALNEYTYVLQSQSYQLILKPSDDVGSPIRKTLSARELMKHVSWLRYKNKEGFHIIGRPMSLRYILVDDILRDEVDAMVADGLPPNLVVETSPDNFQAWIALFPLRLVPPENGRRGTDHYTEWAELQSVLVDGDIQPNIATAAARLLAQRYGGDMRSANAGHLGRLPEFRNLKPMYETDTGAFPWTRIKRVPRQTVAPGALALLRDAITTARSVQRPSSSPLGGCGPISTAMEPTANMTSDEARAIYDHALATLTERFGGERFAKDRSAADFSVARHLALNGFSEAEIATVLLHGSDKAGERGLPYVACTIAAARVQ